MRRAAVRDRILGGRGYSQSVRGQLFGERCAVCQTEFTDEDVPIYTGRFAALAATGVTMTCRHCREWAQVKARNELQRREQISIGWQVLKFEALTAWRVPNIVRWLSRRLVRPAS